MTTWHKTAITDKTGKLFWSGDVSEMALDGEIRTLQRHLDNINNSHLLYAKIPIDVETAHIIVDGERLKTMDEIFEDLEKEAL